MEPKSKVFFHGEESSPEQTGGPSSVCGSEGGKREGEQHAGQGMTSTPC